MKKRLKRIIAFMLALTMIVCSVPSSSMVFAEDAETDTGKSTEEVINTEDVTTEEVKENADVITTEENTEEVSSETPISTENASSEELTTAIEDSSEATSEEVTTEVTDEASTKITEEATSEEEVTEEETSEEVAKEDKEKTEEKEDNKDKFVEFDHIYGDVDVSGITTSDLFVKTSNPKVFTKNTNVVSNYDDVYIISCDNVNEAQSVYSYYLKKVSFICDLRDTMTLSENDKEEEKKEDKDAKDTKDVADLSDVNKDSEDAIANLNDIDVKDYTDYIALIDSGVSAGIEKLSVIGDNGADNVGHGTNMYKYIKEENPDAKVVSIKAFDNNTANVADVYAALRVAIDAKVSVINLSFSAYDIKDNEPVKELINEAISKGITVIGSAGNLSTSAKGFIPGCIDGTVTVGAVNEDGTLYKTSNYDADLYVVANSTSEAAARYSGIFTSGKESDKVYTEFVEKDDLVVDELEIEKGEVTTEKHFTLKYLFVNEDCPYTSIDELFEKSPDSMVYQSVEVPTVYKQDDVYMIHTDAPYKNGIAKKAIMDYAFANSNSFGEVVTEGVRFDADKNIAYIKEDAFTTKEGNFSDGQLQVLVPLSDYNAKIAVNVYNANGYQLCKDTISLDIFDTLCVGFDKVFEKEDFKSIAVNGVETSDYSLDANMIYFNILAINAYSIDITLNTTDTFVLNTTKTVSVSEYLTQVKKGNAALFEVSADNFNWWTEKAREVEASYTSFGGSGNVPTNSTVSSYVINDVNGKSYDGSESDWKIKIPNEHGLPNDKWVEARCVHISASSSNEYVKDTYKNHTTVKVKTIKKYTEQKIGGKKCTVAIMSIVGVFRTSEGASTGQHALGTFAIYCPNSNVRAIQLEKVIKGDDNGTKIVLPNVWFIGKNTETGQYIGLYKTDANGHANFAYPVNSANPKGDGPGKMARRTASGVVDAGAIVGSVNSVTLEELGICIAGVPKTSNEQAALTEAYNAGYSSYIAKDDKGVYSLKNNNIRVLHIDNDSGWYVFINPSYKYTVRDAQGKATSTNKTVATGNVGNPSGYLSQGNMIASYIVGTHKPTATGNEESADGKKRKYTANNSSWTIKDNIEPSDIVYNYAMKKVWNKDNTETIDGATYNIYSDAACTAFVKTVQTSNGGWIAFTSKSPTPTPPVYYARETAKPAGTNYVVDSTSVITINPLTVNGRYLQDPDFTPWDANVYGAAADTFRITDHTLSMLNDAENIAYIAVHTESVQPRYVAVRKIDEKSGKPIPGIKFNVTFDWWHNDNNDYYADSVVNGAVNGSVINNGVVATFGNGQKSTTAVTDANGVAYVVVNDAGEGQVPAVTFTEIEPDDAKAKAIWNFQNEDGTYPNRNKKISVKVKSTNTDLTAVKNAAATYTLTNHIAYGIYLIKSSSKPEKTDGNNNYSLKGAEYKLYKVKTDAEEAAESLDFSKAIGTFTTDETGKTNRVDIYSYMNGIDAGVPVKTPFYVVESKAAERGYLRNTNVIEVPVEPDKAVQGFPTTDEPVDDPLSMTIHKFDSFGNVDKSFDGGVTFSYDFYAADMYDTILTRDEVIASGKKVDAFSGTTTCDENGKLELARTDFPRGYVVLNETEWPDDYDISSQSIYIENNGEKIDLTKDLYFVTDVIMNEDGTDADRITYYPNGAKTYAELTGDKGIGFKMGAINNPDIEITAYNAPIRGDIELYKFDETTGKAIEGVKFSIENMYTHEKHYIYTNKDGYATTRVGRNGYGNHMNYYDEVADYDNTITDATVWFGVDKDANEVKPSDWHGYPELMPDAMWGSSVNDNTDMASPEYLIGSYRVKEERCAANQVDGLRLQLEPAKIVHISSSHQLLNVYDEDASNSERKVWNTKEPIIHTKARVVETSSKTADEDSEDGIDRLQTLAQAGGNVDYKNQTIEDTVYYEKLRAKATDYTFLAELMIVDKEGNVSAYPSDENPLKVVKTITTPREYKKSVYEITGETVINIPGVDPTGLEEQGKKLVVYESLYLGKYNTVEELETAIKDKTFKTRYDEYTEKDDMDFFPVIHQDKNDDFQTVRPADMHTTVLNNVNQDRISNLEEITVTDRVYYQGLTPGKEYTINGKVVVKDYGKNITRITYDPQNPDANEEGFVRTVEEVDNTDEATDETKTENENTDENANDATNDNANADNNAGADDKANETEDKKETVEPVSGVYFLKDAEGNPVTSSKTFVAESSDGYVDLEFTIDATKLQNKSTVIFEELMYKDVKLAIHADVNDEDETIHHPEIGTMTYNSELKDALNDNTTIKSVVDGLNIDVINGIIAKNSESEKTDDKEVATEEKKDDANEAKSDDTKTDETKTDDTTKDGTVADNTDGTKDDKAAEETKADDKAEKTDDKAEINDDTAKAIEAIDIKDIATMQQVEALKENKSFTDRIYYRNLLANRKYIAKGVLMDKETKKPMKDAAGKEITAELEFSTNEIGEVVLNKSPNAVNYVLEDGTVMDMTADVANYACEGYIDVVFTGYDFSNLANKTGTVFEEIYMISEPTDKSNNEKTDEDKKSGQYLVATHKEIDDVTQFIYFVEAKTNAKDLTTAEKIVPYDMQTTIEDTVTYKNLIPGKEYKLKASIHVKNDKSGTYKDGDALLGANGAPVEVEATFTPEKADGETKVNIPIHTNNLKAMQIVVFENLYNQYGIEIATHSDLTDVNQTLEVPKALTSASVTEFEDIREITLVDTISYNNFVPGKTYIAKGYLVDKETGEKVVIDGVEVTAEQEFVPETTDGTVDVTFKFSGEALSGSYVVFEEVYIKTTDISTNTPKEILITEHKDLTDDGQTVTLNLYLAVKVEKTDAKGKYLLDGAEITLYNKEDDSVAKDTKGKRCIAVTDEDGIVSFTVPYGEYYAKETKAPEGYKLNDEEFDVVPSITGRDDLVTDTIDTVEIHDEEIVTPPIKTDDMMPFGILLFALGLGVTGIVIYKKKKKTLD